VALKTACCWLIARTSKRGYHMQDPYKVLQTILERVRDRSTEARYSKDPRLQTEAILDNQERLAEAMLVVGSLLQAIVDHQITVVVPAPRAENRS
jgi:hypothetical protein